MGARRATQAPNVARAALLPGALALLAVLVYAVDLPLLVAGACVAPLLVLYAAAPAWSRASARRFDREALPLLSIGDAKGLRRLYRRSLGLSLFGPPAVRWERWGLVAAETGDPRAACSAFKRAIAAYDRPQDVPLSIEIGLAHAHYDLGADRLAIEAYEKVLARAGALPRVRQNLAHALIRREERLREALDLLQEASREVADAPSLARVELLRALAEAKRGRRTAARKRLAAAGEHESLGSLRAEVEAELDAD